METLIGESWHKIATSSGAFGKGASLTITKEEAMTLYHTMVTRYETAMAGDKEQKLTRQMLAGSKGTLADRVSALISLTEAGPVFSLGHVKRMLTMTQKKNVREQLLAIEALKKMYMSELLPSNRKLKFYDEHSAPVQSETQALLRYFEDQLKLSFAAFVQLLAETCTKQSLAVVQSKTLETAFELLRAKPEQERALLTIVVAGLGPKVDEKAVSGKSNLLLRKLANEHERMKEAIVAEVRNQHLSRLTDESLTSAYWAVNFLHGLTLNAKNDGDVARTIVETLIHVVVFCGERTGADEFKTKLTRLALEGLQKAFVIAKDTAVLTSPLSEVTVKALLKLSYETSVPNLAVAVLGFLVKAVDANSQSRELVRALYYQVGRLDVLVCSAAKALVALVINASDKLVSDEKLAILRRLLASLLAVADPCDALLALVSDKIKASEAEFTGTAELKVDARDPAHAQGGAKLWEQVLVDFSADESLALKKRPALTPLEVLKAISQPERVTAFAFGKRHAEVLAIAPKRQKIEKVAEDDEEIDEFMNNLGKNDEEQEDDGLDLDDAELEGLGGDDDGDSFGESFDGSDLDASDMDDDEEASDSEEDDEEAKRAKKTQALLKKFSGQTFVSAEDFDHLDL